MKTIRLVVGPLGTNCYVVLDEDSGAGAVIDPGADAEKIIRCCEKRKITPTHIIDTHAHCDHTGANAPLKDRCADALLCIGEKDAALLRDAGRNLSLAFGVEVGSVEPDLLLTDGQELAVGSLTLKVLETPGHTPGGISLLAAGEDPPVLFCGDLVFAGSVGRTDLPGGDMAVLQASIREKLLSLPPQTVIRPGHGPKTTLGEEQRSNPFLLTSESV